MPARYATAQQCKIAEKQMDIETQALFALGCATGFRISELLATTWNDLRPKDATLKLDAQRMKGKKRGRLANYNQHAARALANLAREQIAYFSDKVDHGKSLTALPEKEFTAIFKMHRATAHRRITAALGSSAHSMRKIFATRAYRKLGDVLLTSIVLGHVDPRNTLRYIHGLGVNRLWKIVHSPTRRQNKIGFRRSS